MVYKATYIHLREKRKDTLNGLTQYQSIKIYNASIFSLLSNGFAVHIMYTYSSQLPVKAHDELSKVKNSISACMPGQI